MKKVKILLSVAAVVAVVAISAASARINARIYTHQLNDPAGKCFGLVTAKTFVPTTTGTESATTLQGADCQLGVISDVAN